MTGTSTGGGAGTQTAGGAGGVNTGVNTIGVTSMGQPGSLGAGGAGAPATGGGGGGGRYGGGGGASVLIDLSSERAIAGSGGRGGSSLVPAGGSGLTITTDPASVTISYSLAQPLRFDAHAYGSEVSFGRYTLGPTAPANLACTLDPGSDTGHARHVDTTATGTRGDNGTQRAHATSTLTGGQAGVTTSESITTTATAATPAGSDAVTTNGDTTFTGVRVDGERMPYHPAPNTTIRLHHGTVILNEQTPITSADGEVVGRTVNALDVTLGGLHVILGHTAAALTTPDTSCPTP